MKWSGNCLCEKKTISKKSESSCQDLLPRLRKNCKFNGNRGAQKTSSFLSHSSGTNRAWRDRPGKGREPNFKIHIVAILLDLRQIRPKSILLPFMWWCSLGRRPIHHNSQQRILLVPKMLFQAAANSRDQKSLLSNNGFLTANSCLRAGTPACWMQTIPAPTIQFQTLLLARNVRNITNALITYE